MPCIEELNCEVLLGNCSYQECADYIAANFKEIHYVLPGYRLFDIHLIGIPPIPVGADREDIIFPYLKPCRGSFVLKVPGKNELLTLRIARKKAVRLNGKSYDVICWDGNICEVCPRKKAFFGGYRLVQRLKIAGLSFKLIWFIIRSLEIIRKS